MNETLMPDRFDRLLATANMLTEPQIVRDTANILNVGGTAVYIVQVVRESGADTILLQTELPHPSGGEYLARIVIPARIVQTIDRQRATLIARVRRNAAQRVVEDRLARGESLGNPEALAKAREARKEQLENQDAPKRRKTRKRRSRKTRKARRKADAQ